jgi:hypothetical protein
MVRPCSAVSQQPVCVAEMYGGMMQNEHCLTAEPLGEARVPVSALPFRLAAPRLQSRGHPLRIEALGMSNLFRNLKV